MATNPTVIVGHLNNDELQKSIDALVANVDKGMQHIVESTNTAVDAMEKKLKSLGGIKIDGGGSANGGSSKKAVDAINSVIAAQDKQIKKTKEVEMSFDQMESAKQKSIGKSNVLEQYDAQILALRNRLTEVRKDIDVFNYAIGTGKKTNIEWGQQGLKQANAEAERLMRTISTLERQRNNFKDILAPQGHSIQNYVNSLQKANPELAALNEQFKRGQSLLQQQKTEFEMGARAQRNSADATNQSKESLEALNRASERTIHEERERRDAILQTGQAARKTANELIKQAYEQASSSGENPIMGAKELLQALTEMRQAYFTMSAEERLSPIGRALEEDIKRANEAITVIQGYNKSLMGNNQQNKNEITTQSSLGSLRESLKDLTEQYNRLTIAELSAGKGDAIIRKFQETTRAAQKLQRTLNTPLSLQDAMSAPERTLDDIAYKIQGLQAYKRVIPLDDKKSLNELEQVDTEINRLNRDLNKYMSTTTQTTELNNALARSWNYMKNRLAYYFTVGASTQFVRNLIEVRSQYEMNERALGILIDSAERGTQIFNELSQMALVSPYTLIELSAAAKQLTAYDIAAKDVVDTTRRLADMASAVGVPIERLTYALGQIKAYGYLNSRDARMFANAGIPLVKQLSDYYTELEGKLVSTADVYDRIKKKNIDYNDVMQVMYKMTDEGGKFFDFQAKMADTLKVRLANLTLAWNNMLNDIGRSNQGILTWSIGALRDLFLHWKDFNEALNNAAWAAGLIIGLRALNVLLVKAGVNWRILSKEMTGAGIAGAGVATKMSTVGKSLVAVAKSSMTWWSLLAFAIVDATGTLLGANEAQKALNESVRNGAKDNYENISRFLEQYRDVRNSLYNVTEGGDGKRTVSPHSIDDAEAEKAWEAVREQIELTTTASEQYIAKLLTVDDMSERVRQGFSVLDDVQAVNAALKDIDDDTIKVSKDLSEWWNIWSLPDGLIGNLNELAEAEKNVVKETGSLSILGKDNIFTPMVSQADTAERAVNEYLSSLATFRNDLEETTQSVLDFIELRGWSGDASKIDQVFKQITQKLALDNQLDPQKTFLLQTEMEDARLKAVSEALSQQAQSIKTSYLQTEDEKTKIALSKEYERVESELKIAQETNGRNIAEWNRFTKYLKERHISEITAAYNAMTLNGMKEMDYQSKEWEKFVKTWAEQYAKEHHMSIEDVFSFLKGKIDDANTWSITIPVILDIQKLNEFQKEFNKRAGVKPNAEALSKFAPKADEEFSEWVDNQQKAIASLNEDVKKYKRDQTDFGRQNLKNAEDEIELRKQALDLFNQRYEKEKKNKGRGSQKDPLLDTLKQVVDIIKKTQSEFDTLTQKGMASGDALQNVYGRYSKTLTFINNQLAHYGLPQVDLSKIIKGKNPNDALKFLQQLSTALTNKGLSKLERQKTIEVAIQEFSLKVQTYNLDKITKGLNSELGKLKEEYELAIELDANPEMGNLFADWIGIDMSSLPHTAEEYAKRMTEALNKYLAEEKSGIEIGNLLALTDDDLRMFQQRVDNKELNQVWVDEIVKDTKEARNALKKENSGIAKEWDSLVQKYSEYEYKIAQIQRNANNERKTFALKYGSEEQKERAIVLTTKIATEKDQAKKQELINQLKKLLADIAGDDDAKLKIPVAIDEKELQESAKLAFEEFQKSPDWIIATGELSGMTQKALHGLIEEIEEYKKKAKHLDPKSIQKINRTLRNLHKQVRKGNPFAAIIDVFDRAKDRAEEYDAEIEEVSRSIVDLTMKQQETGKLTDEENKKLGGLWATYNKLKKKQKENSKVTATELVSGISDAVNIAQQGIKVFDELFAAIGGEGSAASQTLKDISAVMDKTMAGAQAGAAFGGYGALIGAVAGAATGLIEVLSQAANRRITEQVEESERAVKRLENAYKHLEEAIENAFGASVIGAKQAAIANKELQLVELKRQLNLEKSRDEKDRDKGKIEDLVGQVIDLQYEIEHAYKEIGNDLLGFSSVAEAAQTMMDAYIEALRSGEDAMGGFNESVNDMIANLIKQIFVTRVIAPQLEKIMDDFNERITQRSEAKAQEYQDAVKYLTDVMTQPDVALSYEAVKSSDKSFLGRLDQFFNDIQTGATPSAIREAAAREVERLQKELESISTPKRGDVRELTYALRSIEPELAAQTQEMLDWLNEFGLMKTSSKNNLSNLQQGISQITESTAEAIEAYMNSVSQQVYYHSSLLEQIRDTVVGFDMETQLGIQSQMLLQMQQSYQVQMSIENILQSVLNPSGRAFNVELVS